ncbi:hypothetical protein Dsin_022205 [Dipteronia sinensis]|uniref:Uncharacterized protein n=1 Tax=Dipteronia sinensis TaxID=43782 RepID=A0AAE0DZJ4_9ROSI|nr:hypothetical protein Dsin_022205 [Dipteronia sinensis]
MANWTDPIYRKGFIDLCLQEVNNGYRSGGTLTPCAWNRIDEGLDKTYPETKQFRQKPLASFEELDSLFSGVSATEAHIWSFEMQGIPELGNTSTDFASSMYGGSYARLLEKDDNTPTQNLDVKFEEHPIQNVDQPKKIKEKKS